MPAPQGRQPKVDDEDDIEAELAALDAAIKSGNPGKLASAVDGLLDDDAVPPHEYGDDDETPAPKKKSSGKKAAKAQVPDEDEEDATHDEDADDAVDSDADEGQKPAAGAKKKASQTVEEDNEAVVGDVDEQSADADEDLDGSVPKPKQPGSIVKNLRALGYQVGDDLDEETAAQLLVRHHADTTALANDNAHLIRLGQMVAANPELYQQLAGQKKGQQQDEGNVAQRGGDDAVSKLNTPAALQRLSALGEKWKGLAKKPEYDPDWESSGVQFTGRMYVAPANNPGLAPIAEKLNAYRKWQLQQMEVSTDLPDILESVQEAIKSASTGGLTEDRIREILKENSGRAQHESVAMNIAQKNAAWMFLYSGGQPIRSPNGSFVFSPEGEKYDKYFNMLVKSGMNPNTPDGLQKISDIAISLIGNDLDKEAKKAAPKKTPSGVDASGAAGKKLGNDTSDEGDEQASAAADKTASLKARRKAMASGKSGGKAGISSGGAKPDDRSGVAKVVNPAKSLAAEFAEELAKAGITDGNITFGDGDGDDD